MTTRIIRSSAVVLAALLAGACGSSAAKSAGTTPTSAAKLALTKAGGAASGAADSAAKPGALAVRPVTYVLDGTLPDLGTSAAVYRWTAHATTVADVNRLAEALGITATATTTADGTIVATDGNATVLVSTAGGSAQVSYFLGGYDDGTISSGSGGASTGSAGSGVAPDGGVIPPDAPPVGPVTTIPPILTPPVDVPSAQDAETIARALLDRMGVLDGQQWQTDVTDSGGIAVTCAVGEKCTGVSDQVSARDVTFTLTIDGARVEGMSWNVTVGEHSKVTSVYGEWGSAAVLGTYDLRSTADAFAALQNGTNFGGVEPVAGDVPVAAQTDPATTLAPIATGPNQVDPAPPETIPDGSNPTGTVPMPTTPEPGFEVHVTGAALGIGRWDAVDGNQNVVDLVPMYLFHTRDADGNVSDVSVLALDPAAIDFANPIAPLPVPSPGRPVPEPAPVTGAPAPGSEPGSGPVKPSPAG